MGASGFINLDTSSIATTSRVREASTSDGDIYNYTVDLTSTLSFTLTGDFNEATGGTETSYSHFFTTPSVGTFTILNDGTFTYTVTRADLVAASQTTVSIDVTGNVSSGVDTDTLNFTFTLCFAAGSMIATPDGECVIEDLAIGDLVQTTDGRAVPVKWVARSTISPMFNPADRLEPVRIRKGALGPNTPHTDLIVTADHGMIIDDLLINAGALVNGSTIDWYPWKALGTSLTYYHVETEGHDTILANGAAAETLLDMPSRRSFENFAEYAALYGTEQPVTEMSVPRIATPRLLPQSIRDRLGIADEATLEQFEQPLRNIA